MIREEADFILPENAYGEEAAYTEILNDTLCQMMDADESVILFGEGINDKVALFGVTTGLAGKYGEERVFDVPLSESALMGIAAGAALEGLRPVFFHNRPDFILLAMDQFANHATKYRYMSGGIHRVPMVIWAAIGKGWGAAAQHSQSLQSVFAHFPGCKVVMPTTPFDGKGLLVSALMDEMPVVILEHRELLRKSGVVPKELYRIGMGKGVLRRKGDDFTVVADSVMVDEAMKAAGILEDKGISVDVIDIRSIKPWDKEIVLRSVKKTGRLLVADTAWHMCNFGAEVIATVYEEAFSHMRAPAIRVDYPDIAVPAGWTLEEEFYTGYGKIVEKIMESVKI